MNKKDIGIKCGFWIHPGFTCKQRICRVRPDGDDVCPDIKVKDCFVKKLLTKCDRYRRERLALRKALDEIKRILQTDDTGDYDFLKWKLLNYISKGGAEKCK